MSTFELRDTRKKLEDLKIWMREPSLSSAIRRIIYEAWARKAPK